MTQCGQHALRSAGSRLLSGGSTLNAYKRALTSSKAIGTYKPVGRKVTVLYLGKGSDVMQYPLSQHQDCQDGLPRRRLP